MGATNFTLVDSSEGYQVNGVTVIDSSGNIDAPITTTNLSTTGTTTLGNSADQTTINGPTTINSNSASALVAGANGATNPVLKVDASTASVATGLSVTGAAAAGGVAVTALSSGTNENLTVAAKGNGAVILGQATSTDLRLAGDQPIADSSGNELLKFVKTASAVNEVTFTNAATGNNPTISATGVDTNIGLTIEQKGAANITFGNGSTTGMRLFQNQPILDGSSNELIKFSSTASAVNEVTITNAATNTGPTVSATGVDSNIPLMLAAKGTQSVIANAPFIAATGTVLSANTAGDTTLTAAQVLAGIAVIDPNGAGRNLIFPTATNLIAAVPGCVIGQTFILHVVNGADAAETITLVADASGAFDANQTAASRVIPQNSSKDVYVRITDVGTPAYVIYA